MAGPIDPAAGLTTGQLHRFFVVQLPNSEERSIFTDFCMVMQVNLPELFAKAPTVITGVTSILSGLYNLKQARDKSQLKLRVNEVERGIVEPVQIGSSETRNSIVLLGLGGSGKTSLIRNVFQQKKATPERTTSEYTIYRSSHSIENQKCNFFVSDYVGQNLGNLVGSFIEQQKIPFSEMSYGYINSLVLVVDLFPPKASPVSPDLEPAEQPDLERVTRHLHQWNETALDAVFGMLTVPELSYVCLFVNKYDLISNNSPQSRRSIEALYQKLYAYLSFKVSGQGVESEMMLGSASSGESLQRLLERFIKFSVPARPRSKK